MTTLLKVRRLPRLLCALLLAGLAACSSLPSMPSMNPMDWFAGPSGPKPSELPTLSNAQAVTRLWTASVRAPTIL